MKSNLGKYFKLSNYICVRGYGFWIALGAGLYLCVTQYIKEALFASDFLDMYKKAWPSMLVPHSVFTKWIGGEMFTFQYFAFFMIIPLLTNLPAGNGLVNDIRKRYIINTVIRGDRATYYLAKIFTAFWSGGFVVIFPLLVNLYLTAMTLPSIVPSNATGFFAIRNGWLMADLFYSKPYAYIFIYFIIIFLFSGIIAAFSTALGWWGIAPFLNMLYPFIVSVALYTFLGEFRVTAFTPFYFLNPAQIYRFSVPAVLLEVVMMLTFVVLGYFRGKRIEIY